MKTGVFNRYRGPLLVCLWLLCLPLVTAPVFSMDSEWQTVSSPYRQQELAQLLAPIALYPDALLAQILIASTYPIEIIEAQRWVKRAARLDAGALDDALYAKEWDPSVKVLCHFPSILKSMSEHLSETINLGNAFLVQEDDVMEMVQRLREKAYVAGNLRTTRQQRVIIESATIVIEPTYARIIYIPDYDPYSVYGSWWYPDYPPCYWGPSDVRLGLGLSFSSGVVLNFVFDSWSSFDWQRRAIYINGYRRPRFVQNVRLPAKEIWRHSASHRRGVAYSDKRTAQTYGQTVRREQPLPRESRGYDDDRYRVQPVRRDASSTDIKVEVKYPTIRPVAKYQEPLRTIRQQPTTPVTSDPAISQKAQTLTPRLIQKPLETEPARSVAPRRDQQRDTRETRQAPAMRVSGHKTPREEQQLRQKDVSVFGQEENADMERKSSRRGKASRQDDAKKQHQ